MMVLLIDDAVASVNVRADLLRALGHEVFTAQTGAEGLDLFLRQPVGVTVLDLGLPDLDGEAVLRRMRAMQQDARVIVLTGRLDVPVYVEAEADAVLLKGVGGQALVDALRG